MNKSKVIDTNYKTEAAIWEFPRSLVSIDYTFLFPDLCDVSFTAEAGGILQLLHRSGP